MEIICKQEAPQPVSTEDAGTSSKEEQIIVCALCNHHITDPSKQIIVNQSFRHIFANPHGYVFEVGCFSHALGIRRASSSSREFSWFAGYSWTIGVCSRCDTHLGWIFSSESNTFFCLILEKIIIP